MYLPHRYQGESNDGAEIYACAFPSMITSWRENFQNKNLWFGFVQIAGHDYQDSFGSGDVRQAQLRAYIQLANVGMSSAIDTGDFGSFHPPDKQNPAKRLANQALEMIYGHTDTPGRQLPMYAGSKVVSNQEGTVVVSVDIRVRNSKFGSDGAHMDTWIPTSLTTDAPLAALQSTTLNETVSVARNTCVYPILPQAKKSDCGYPVIYGMLKDGSAGNVTASAEIGTDGSSIVLTAVHVPVGFVPTASSYGRAGWPMTLFFSNEGGEERLPVIPWYNTFNSTDPSVPPSYH